MLYFRSGFLMGYYYNMHLQKHFRQNILCLRNANSAKSVLTFLLSREIYLTSSDPILTHFLIVYLVFSWQFCPFRIDWCVLLTLVCSSTISNLELCSTLLILESVLQSYNFLHCYLYLCLQTSNLCSGLRVIFVLNY